MIDNDPWLECYMTKNYEQFKGQGFSIGKYTYGIPKVLHHIRSQTTLTIGKFCSIAENVTILMGGEHNIESISNYPFNPMFTGICKDGVNTKGNVTIGNDVWLCINSTILSGITIGDGAVIGAGAVVVKDVPPYAIMVGNPSSYHSNEISFSSS